MRFGNTIRLLGIVVVVVVAATSANADTIVLVNGDTVSGKVVVVNKELLTFDSELLGEVHLPRGKVAAIYFGDRKPPVTAAQPAADGKAAGQAIGQLLGDRAKPPAAKGATPEEVVEQLRKQGLDAKSVDALRKQFPLLGTPEAGGYFNKTLSGLVDGSIDVQDIRKDAVHARDELKGLKKDLGPQGAALDGYLRILENFIDQTEPAKDKTDKP